MKDLLDFIYDNRILGFFLLLQIICIWLITSSNRFYNAAYFNTSNAISGSISSFSENSANYFDLREKNKRLANENAQLRELIAQSNFGRISHEEELDNAEFKAVSGKIINKTFRRSVNFLTLAAGAKDGIAPGMGVVTGNGIVGRVQSVSEDFCTVTSILHPSVMVSSEVKKNNVLCTSQWEVMDYQRINIKYIPRHTDLIKGDTIVTSGYNSVFPTDIMVGIVDSVYLSNESPFYWATAKLSVDFATLDYAYVLFNDAHEEIIELEKTTVEEL